MIPRFYDNLDELLHEGRVTVVYGPRRVGKTTLIKNFLAKTKLRAKFDSGDNLEIRNIFSSQSFSVIDKYTEGYDLLVIDEAQRIPNIGFGLKILVRK